MRKTFFFLSLLLPIFAAVEGEIIEAGSFKEIQRYITDETLLVVDIDDTLLIPVQTLGSDVWFISRLERHKESLCDPLLALDRALAEWEAVRHLTEVKIVEEGSEELLADLQKNRVAVMGLTTQGLALATRTVNQLRSLEIDLAKTAPSPADHYFINGAQGVLYRHGILFTSGTAKGPALLTLLSHFNYRPKQVIFINDKRTHLRDVEQSLEEAGIPFIGLRYSFSDERVANFDKNIAELQWKYSSFDHILSDEEAAALLRRRECLVR